MSKRWLYAIDGLLLGFVGAMAYDAAGQTLQPVDTGGGFSLWMVIAIGVVIVLVAILIIWHKRNPSGQTKALAEAHTELTGLIGKFHDMVVMDRLPPVSSFQHHPQLLPGSPVAEIDPDKLAAVEAARVAYENAKADAGIP